MNPLIRKEIRLLAPAWIAAVVLVILGNWVRPEFYGLNQTVAMGSFGLGALLLCLSAFGQEFSMGTFQQLLAQPTQRSQIWNAKMLTLGFALFCVFALMFLGWMMGSSTGWLNTGGADPLFAIVTILAVCAGALWTSLLLKQVAAAFWAAIFIPFALFSLFLSVGWLKLENNGYQALCVVMLLYSAASFWAARKLFFRAQDTQWTGGNIGAPAFWRQLLALRFLGRNPISALIRKELQLQTVPVFMAGVLVLLSGILILVDRISPLSETTRFTVFILMTILWFCIPFMVGSAAVSEERRMNTLEGQLCLPSSRRQQFAIKLLVTLLVGIVLGGVLPGPFAWLGQHFIDDKIKLKELKEGLWTPIVSLSGAAAVITFLAFYASTLTRSILQAMGAAIGVGCLGILFIPNTLRAFGLAFPNYMVLGSAIFVITLFCLAFRNFKRPRMDRAGWTGNAVSIAAAYGIFMGATAGIYYKAWEFFMPWEPKHSVARIDPAGKAKICAGRRAFVLLPDGRIWAANAFRYRVEWDGRSFRKNGKKQLDINRGAPISGTFLEETNWVDMAMNFDKLYAIKTDGTLWSIDLPRPKWPSEPGEFIDSIDQWDIEQVGSDADWTSISSGQECCLVLKKDGSLWGFGSNSSGQLGPDVKKGALSPVRIGKDSDWVSVFAKGSSAPATLGIKANGTVWCWGNITEPFIKGADRRTDTHPEPMEWAFRGTNWISLYNVYHHSIGLRDDGALFVVGMWERTFFGATPRGGNSALPQKVGDSEWKCFSAYTYSECAGIKRNGTLWVENFYAHHVRCPSKYHDWVAISDDYGYTVALAADGTLCWWVLKDDRDSYASRRAKWSINIFE